MHPALDTLLDLRNATPEFAGGTHLIAPLKRSGMPPLAVDLLTDARHDLRRGLALPAHGVLWLRVNHARPIV